MCPPPTPCSAPPPPRCAKVLTESIIATAKRPVRVFMSPPVTLFRQLENRNRVAVRKSHLEIAASRDGEVLDAVDHIRDGRRVHPGAKVEPPELRAARGIERI